MLGHAIEYLADEVLCDGRPPTASDNRVQAMEILKTLNREIYFECPIVPTLHERMHLLFHSLVNPEHDLGQARKQR
jgi:hypothetical protein